MGVDVLNYGIININVWAALLHGYGLQQNILTNNRSKSRSDKFNGKMVGIMSNDGSLKDSIK